jgi:DNA-binding winged helix-turn-helix (wHTH) protein
VIYRFDGFSLDAGARQVIFGGHEVHLSPKAFELLHTLVENRARALSKSELQERLWPSTFVDDTNLATLVAEIRRALGDSATQSRFVRTVHRFGYRFVAPVAEGDDSPTAMQTTLRLYLTAGERQFLLAQGGSILGRGRDTAIRLDSAGVSRHHARIIVRGDAAHIDDLASKNGTFVNGERVVTSNPLKDGDEIRLGPIALTFRAEPLTAATETMSQRF